MSKDTEPRPLSAEERAWVDGMVSQHYAWVKASAFYLGKENYKIADPLSWAEDMTQEVFLRLNEKAAKLIRHPNIRGWLKKTLHYVIRNYLQKQSNQEVPVAEVWDGAEEPSYEFAYGDRDVLFPPDMNEQEKFLLYRRYCEECSCKDIARELGISPAACRMRLHRAEKKFRKLKKKRNRSTHFERFRPVKKTILQEGGAEHV